MDVQFCLYLLVGSSPACSWLCKPTHDKEAFRSNPERPTKEAPPVRVDVWTYPLRRLRVGSKGWVVLQVLGGTNRTGGKGDGGQMNRKLKRGTGRIVAVVFSPSGNVYSGLLET